MHSIELLRWLETPDKTELSLWAAELIDVLMACESEELLVLALKRLVFRNPQLGATWRIASELLKSNNREETAFKLKTRFLNDSTFANAISNQGYGGIIGVLADSKALNDALVKRRDLFVVGANRLMEGQFSGANTVLVETMLVSEERALLRQDQIQVVNKGFMKNINLSLMCPFGSFVESKVFDQAYKRINGLIADTSVPGSRISRTRMRYQEVSTFKFKTIYSEEQVGSSELIAYLCSEWSCAPELLV